MFYKTPKFSNTDTSKPRSLFKRIVTFLGFKGIFSLFFILLVTIFSLQNIESTSVQFLFWKILEVSKLYLILISIFMGTLLGFILGFRFKQEKFILR